MGKGKQKREYSGKRQTGGSRNQFSRLQAKKNYLQRLCRRWEKAVGNGATAEAKYKSICAAAPQASVEDKLDYYQQCVAAIENEIFKKKSELPENGGKLEYI